MNVHRQLWLRESGRNGRAPLSHAHHHKPKPVTAAVTTAASAAPSRKTAHWRWSPFVRFAPRTPPPQPPAATSSNVGGAFGASTAATGAAIPTPVRDRFSVRLHALVPDSVSFANRVFLAFSHDGHWLLAYSVHTPAAAAAPTSQSMYILEWWGPFTADPHRTIHKRYTLPLFATRRLARHDGARAGGGAGVGAGGLIAQLYDDDEGEGETDDADAPPHDLSDDDDGGDDGDVSDTESRLQLALAIARRRGTLGGRVRPPAVPGHLQIRLCETPDSACVVVLGTVRTAASPRVVHCTILPNPTRRGGLLECGAVHFTFLHSAGGGGGGDGGGGSGGSEFPSFAVTDSPLSSPALRRYALSVGSADALRCIEFSIAGSGSGGVDADGAAAASPDADGADRWFTSAEWAGNLRYSSHATAIIPAPVVTGVTAATATAARAANLAATSADAACGIWRAKHSASAAAATSAPDDAASAVAVEVHAQRSFEIEPFAVTRLAPRPALIHDYEFRWTHCARDGVVHCTVALAMVPDRDAPDADTEAARTHAFALLRVDYRTGGVSVPHLRRGVDLRATPATTATSAAAGSPAPTALARLSRTCNAAFALLLARATCPVRSGCAVATDNEPVFTGVSRSITRNPRFPFAITL